MMAVPVTTTTPTFAVGAPRVLFEWQSAQGSVMRTYDVTADGQEFVMVQTHPRPPAKPAQMILVQNWFEELKRRVR
jgi:hypothetical protein